MSLTQIVNTIADGVRSFFAKIFGFLILPFLTFINPELKSKPPAPAPVTTNSSQ